MLEAYYLMYSIMEIRTKALSRKVRKGLDSLLQIIAQDLASYCIELYEKKGC